MRPVIGVFEWEKQLKQAVLLDVKVTSDIQQAASSGDLADTVDYKLMAQKLKTFAESRPFGLLETMAEEMAALVLSDFATVLTVTIKIDKPYAVRHAQTVGVIIERKRQEG